MLRRGGRIDVCFEEKEASIEDDGCLCVFSRW